MIRGAGVAAAIVRPGRAMALAAVTVLIAAAAAAGEERVVVQIATVFATNTGEHFDAQLAAVRRHLDKLPHYRSYQLVKRESRDVGRSV